MAKLSKIFQDAGIIERMDPLLMGINIISAAVKSENEMDLDDPTIIEASICEFEDDLGVTECTPMSLLSLFHF